MTATTQDTSPGTGPDGPRIGITVASGMLKGVFGHGVLSAFEERGLRADVYGAASSSGLRPASPSSAGPAKWAWATGTAPPPEWPGKA